LARQGFVPVHDRGRVLADTAVLPDGGRVLPDLAALRDQGELYGPIASDPTLWRALDEIGGPQRRTVAPARAETREHLWSRQVFTGLHIGGTVATTLRQAAVRSGEPARRKAADA
jgi:hypothetical protein